LGKEKLETKPLLPDLAITDLFLTPGRKLAIKLGNFGDSSLSLAGGSLRIAVDGSPRESYLLGSLSDRPFLLPRENITLVTPLSLVGRHEIDARVDFPVGGKESNAENKSLRKVVEGPPVGPDIVVKDLELTEDLELVIVLSNAGEVDLRKGVIFQIQVSVNDQKISEFDHFISQPLKANFKNRYAVAPPYQVGLAGTSKVKVSIAPELPSDDIRLDNNVFEVTFIILPFKIGPLRKEDLSFSIPTPQLRSEVQTEKVMIEARWEVHTSSVMMSFKKSDSVETPSTFSGKSPLRVEFPIPGGEVRKETLWTVTVANLVEKRVEGYLIIQHH